MVFRTIIRHSSSISLSTSTTLLFHIEEKQWNRSYEIDVEATERSSQIPKFSRVHTSRRRLSTASIPAPGSICRNHSCHAMSSIHLDHR